jgi:hypothetical protein
VWHEIHRAASDLRSSSAKRASSEVGTGWALCFDGKREAGGGKWRVALCLCFFYLPPAPFHLSSGHVLRVLLGIVRGLRVFKVFRITE